jgi:hypothetical protein
MARKRDSRSRLSSAFNGMLEQNRKQFEALTNGIGARDREATRSPRSSEIVAPSAPPRPAERSRDAASAAPAPSRSNAVRFLDDRYGDGWSYEIAERRREGDEVIVLCKLSIPDQDISKSQFGRARIAAGGGAGLAGSADGIAFSLGSESEAEVAGAGDPEEAAFQKAVASALAKCAEML